MLYGGPAGPALSMQAELYDGPAATRTKESGGPAVSPLAGNVYHGWRELLGQFTSQAPREAVIA